MINGTQIEPSNLEEALAAEMARVRDRVLPVYVTLGPQGEPGAVMMRYELDAAALELASGDVAAMIRRLESLRGWTL